MADKKISQLTGATTPLGGTEEVPLVQSSTTKKVTVENLTAGRSVPAASFQAGGRVTVGSSYIADVPGPTGNNTGVLFGGNTIFPCDGNGSLTNGVASLGTSSYQWYDIFLANNVNIRTAAKGVNFTANTPAAGMTSQLLNWYEEGTCSFTVTSTGGTLTTASASAVYTRVGRVVTITGTVTVTTNGTGTGALTVAGLPFTPATAACGVGRESVNNGKTCSFMVSASSTSMSVQAYDNTYPVSSGSVIQFSVSYSV